LLSGDITEKDLEGNEYLVGTVTKDTEEELRKKGEAILNQDIPVIEKGSFKNRQPVTFGNLLKGKQIIKKGAKGAVVRDIQRMLSTLGYELGSSGKLKDGVDGDFGETTDAAIKMFQIMNRLSDVDGTVGKDTATELKKKYDEKRQENN